MPSDERDEQFERALARHLSHVPSDSDCPDAEILAAYHERSLSGEEMARWKEHIAACARCQEALSLVEESENVVTAEEQDQPEVQLAASMAASAPMDAGHRASKSISSFTMAAAARKLEPIRKLRPRASWSWIVPIGAIAASAIVFVGVQEIKMQHAKEAQMVLNRLPAALPPASQVRPMEKMESEKSSAAKIQNGASSPTQQVPAKPSRVQVESSFSSLPRDESDRKAKESAAALTPPPDSKATAEVVAPQANSPATPAAIAAAAPTASAQQDQQNKKVQMSKARMAPELRAPTSASGMMQAETVLAPNPNLLETALANHRYIVAPGEKHAWRLGDGGLIEISTDRGKTWNAQNSGVTADLTTGSATSNDVCWVVGKSGTLLLTVDGGKHWSQLSSPIAADLGGVHATNASHASIWDVPNRNSFETNDGGATWQRTANE